MANPNDVPQGTLATKVQPATWNAIVDRINELGNKVNDVADYGADPTGVADSRSAINDAHTAATASGGYIVFPTGTYKISSGLTFNSNVTLVFHPEGMISIDTSVTVAINGKIDPTLHQIFILNGTGVVTLGVESCEYVIPQWWGAVGDDATDNHAAIEAAITAAVNVGKVYLPGGIYQITSPIDNWYYDWGTDFDTAFVFQGASPADTIIKYTGASDYAIKIYNPDMETLANQKSVNYLTIRDLRVQASGTGSGGGGGIYLTGAHNTIENVVLDDIDATYGTAIKMEDTPYIITQSGFTNDANHDFTTTGAGATEKYAISFTTASNINVWVKSVTVRLAKTGSPAGTMTASIFTDSSGPNAIVGAVSQSVTLNNLNSGADGADQTFTFTYADRPEISTATKYWIVLTTTGYTYTNGVTEVRLRAEGSAGGANTFGIYDFGGSSWSTTTHGANFVMNSGRNWSLWNFVDRIEIHNRDGTNAYRGFEILSNSQISISRSSIDAATVIHAEGGPRIWATSTNFDGTSTTTKPFDCSAVTTGRLYIQQSYFEGGGPSYPIDIGGFFRVAFVACRIGVYIEWNPGSPVDFAGCQGPLLITDDPEMQPAYNRRYMIYTPNRADGTRSIDLSGGATTTGDADALTGTAWSLPANADRVDVHIGDSGARDYTLLPRGVYLFTVYAKATGAADQLHIDAFEDSAGGTKLADETYDVGTDYAPYYIVVPFITEAKLFYVRSYAIGSKTLKISQITLEYLGPDNPHQRDYVAFNTEASDADGARESRVVFQGIQSGDEQSWLASITASHDGAADDEKGKLEISVNDSNDAFSPTPQITIDSVDVTLERGVLALPETTTPTPVDSEGRIYTKSNNDLYFQDGAGDEHVILKGLTGTEHTYVAPLEDPTGTVGNWDIVAINAAQNVHFNLQVPEDFETLSAANIVIIPDTSETIQWDVLVSVAAAGETYNNDDRSALNETLAVTINVLTEVDISGVLAGITAGDYIAIDFQSDTAVIQIVGFEFDYN